MQRRDFLKQVIRAHLEEEKEAIRQAVLSEQAAAPAARRPHRPRRAVWIGAAACACTAVMLGVCLLTGRTSAVPPAASSGGTPVSEGVPLSRAFSLRLCFDGGSTPVQNRIDLQQPCNRFFWADEEETARLLEEMDKGHLHNGDSGHTFLEVSYHQDYFQRPENFITLQTAWLELQGDNLQTVRLQCENGEVSYFHPGIRKEYRERYPDAESLEKTVMEEEGFTSALRLPWRQRHYPDGGAADPAAGRAGAAAHRADVAGHAGRGRLHLCGLGRYRAHDRHLHRRHRGAENAARRVRRGRLPADFLCGIIHWPLAGSRPDRFRAAASERQGSIGRKGRCETRRNRRARGTIRVPHSASRAVRLRTARIKAAFRRPKVGKIIRFSPLSFSAWQESLACKTFLPSWGSRPDRFRAAALLSERPAEFAIYL